MSGRRILAGILLFILAIQWLFLFLLLFVAIVAGPGRSDRLEPGTPIGLVLVIGLLTLVYFVSTTAVKAKAAFRKDGYVGWIALIPIACLVSLTICLVGLVVSAPPSVVERLVRTESDSSTVGSILGLLMVGFDFWVAIADWIRDH